jgi:hypothetical protein
LNVVPATVARILDSPCTLARKAICKSAGRSTRKKSEMTVSGVSQRKPPRPPDPASPPVEKALPPTGTVQLAGSRPDAWTATERASTSGSASGNRRLRLEDAELRGRFWFMVVR